MPKIMGATTTVTGPSNLWVEDQ